MKTIGVTMQITIFCVIIGVAQTFLSGKNCGPSALCTCPFPTEMDCVNTTLPLKKICLDIGNQTIKLRAERNDFQEVVADDLNGCRHLKTLLLPGNNISFHQNGTFFDLSDLETLDLSNNRISLVNDTFYMKTQFPLTLKTLKVNSKFATSLSEYYPDLAYLTYLRELHINGLPNIDFPTSYRNKSNLTTIVMSGLKGNCNITQITNETFKHLVHVKKLNISDCNITNIFSGAFQELKNLEVLDLSLNRRMGIRMFRNITFGLQFTNIKSVNVSKVQNTFGRSTMISTRDVCYAWNSTINEIVINSNRIELIETNALILLSKTVEILHVEDNKFTFGPYLLQLGCLAHLTEIYASYQNLAHSPTDYDREEAESDADEQNVQPDDCPFMTIDFLRNVSKTSKYCRFFDNEKKISIKRNFPMFPKTTKKVHFAESGMEYNVSNVIVIPLANNIEYLDFSGNVLHGLTGPLGPFPNVRYADFSKSYCSFIGTKFFEGFITLENLQIQQNFLGLVFEDTRYGPHVFQKLVNVKTLNLSSNIISYIPPGALSSMVVLETLDLSINNIEQWTIDVTNLNNLLYLNLRTNFLQTLPSYLTVKLEKNSKRLNRSFLIDIRNNPIKIDCIDRGFLEWMVRYKINFVQFDENSFQDSSGNPISADLFVRRVKDLHKTCESYTIELVFGSVGLFVFLAILAGGFVYKHRWSLRYLLRLTKIRQFGYNELPNKNFAYDAFVSYAEENRRFVLDEFVSKLEQSGLHLCYHDRDFKPGTPIGDNIVNAVQKSRMTIIILSEDFLKSYWCKYEFMMARMETFYSRKGNNCLLLVIYEHVQHENLSLEMSELMATETYVEYNNDQHGLELFWEKIFSVVKKK